jgi:hypothetical protein
MAIYIPGISSVELASWQHPNQKARPSIFGMSKTHPTLLDVQTYDEPPPSPLTDQNTIFLAQHKAF